MTTYSWATNTSGDWNTGTNWAGGVAPNDPTADVTIDAPTTVQYGVTIAAGEAVTINSLALNPVNDFAGTNPTAPNPYAAAVLEVDGTLTFAPGSPGAISGSLQTVMTMNGGTIVNAGTVDAFIQAQGSVLFTGTNGFYVTNWLQSLSGDVTIDTSSIAELNASTNTLFDGIFESKSDDAAGYAASIKLGGPRENLIVNIATIEGPPLIPDGWTELFLNGTNSSISEWNGTGYVSIETTLQDIASRGTVDVLSGRNYTTANTLSIDGGLLNLQAGTVTAAALDINTGIVQGFATIAGPVVNNSVLDAEGGTLTVAGALTGTGKVVFDIDNKAGTVSATGATLAVGSVSAGQTITMNGDDTLVLTSPAAFAGTIVASVGDKIVLQGATVTSASLNNGTLSVMNGSATVATLNLGGSYAGDGFAASGSTITVGKAASVTLTQVVNEYELTPAGGGAGPALQYQGSPVTVGGFGAWAPVAAATSGSGYQVVWQNGPSFTVWNVDPTGAYVSDTVGTLSGTSLALETLETSFNQDFNGDGQIGPVSTTISTNAGTTLVQVGDQFQLNPAAGGTGPTVTLQGAPATSGLLGAWTPIGAVAVSGGYEIVFKNGSQSIYTAWNVDSTGAFVSDTVGQVDGNSLALETLETTFQQDLNGDGTIGPAVQTVGSSGSATLTQMGNEYQVTPVGGGAGLFVSYQGAPVTTGQFGTWTPISVAAVSGGYQLAWKEGSQDAYTAWNLDSTGAFTGDSVGVVSGASFALETLETTFQQDLNGDGTIGLVTTAIESSGTTALVQAGDQYQMNPVAGGTGPSLSYQGAAVTVGQFGTWAPVAAEATSSGYDVVWKNGTADQYTVWNTDTNGAYVSDPTGVATGQSFAIEDLEPVFQQDLNGDGKLSASLVTAPASGNTVDLTALTAAATVNLGGNTASASAGLNAPSLTFIGTPDAITIGASAATIEYALTPASGIEEVTGFTYGTDALNIDLSGAANSVLQAYDTTVGGVAAIAVASSADPAHGVVLLNVSGGQTAADLLANHVTFTGGHALIG